jgi:hypothetical protein
VEGMGSPVGRPVAAWEDWHGGVTRLAVPEAGMAPGLPAAVGYPCAGLLAGGLEVIARTDPGTVSVG